MPCDGLGNCQVCTGECEGCCSDDCGQDETPDVIEVTDDEEDDDGEEES